MVHKFTTLTLGALLALALGAESFSQSSSNTVVRIVEPVKQDKESSYSIELFERPSESTKVTAQSANIDDGFGRHIVGQRQSLYTISRLTCIGIDAISEANGLSNYRISLGQELKIPLTEGHCYKPNKIETLLEKRKQEGQARITRLTPKFGVPVGTFGDRFDGNGTPTDYTGVGTVYFMPNNTSVVEETYSGKILNGKAHGKGSYVTDQGVSLTGQWSYGVLDFDSATCRTQQGEHCGLSVMFERPQYHLFDLSTSSTKSIRIDSISFDFSKYEDVRRAEEARLNPPKPNEVYTEAPSGFAAFLANKDVQNALVNSGNSYYKSKTEDARVRQKIANDEIRRQRERDFQNEQNRQLQIRQVERAQKQRETEREAAESSKRMQRDIESRTVTPAHGSVVKHQSDGGTEQPSNYGTADANENDFSENSSSKKDDGCYKIPRTCVTTELDRSEKKTTLWVKNHCGTRMYKTTCLYDTSGKDWCEADWLPADSRKQHYSYNKEITERYKVEVVGSSKGANDWVCASKDELVETFRN